jgi:hypothetical protein
VDLDRHAVGVPEGGGHFVQRGAVAGGEVQVAALRREGQGGGPPDSL